MCRMNSYACSLSATLVQRTNNIQTSEVNDCNTKELFHSWVSAQRFIQDAAKPQHFARARQSFIPYCGQAVVSARRFT
jgi:hypothetical protein